MYLEYFNNFKKFINLSYILAKSEIKSKNSSIYVGAFWQIINSFVLAAVLWFVFNKQLGGNIEYYFAYLLIGVSFFNFFQRTTSAASFKFFEWGAIIKSLNFPYPALVFSVVLESLFSHLLEIIILAMLLIFILKISLLGLLFYPVILIFFILFVYGLSLSLATLASWKMDIGHLWRFISPLFLFATPIFYSAEHPSLLSAFNLFNPLYYFVTMARETVIYRQPSWEMILAAAFFSLAAFIIGNLLFNKMRYRIVEKF